MLNCKCWTAIKFQNVKAINPWLNVFNRSFPQIITFLPHAEWARNDVEIISNQMWQLWAARWYFILFHHGSHPPKNLCNRKPETEQGVVRLNGIPDYLDCDCDDARATKRRCWWRRVDRVPQQSNSIKKYHQHFRPPTFVCYHAGSHALTVCF